MHCLRTCEEICQNLHKQYLVSNLGLQIQPSIHELSKTAIKLDFEGFAAELHNKNNTVRWEHVGL